MKTNLEKIADAVVEAGGRTPSAVVAAFVPESPVVFGTRLRPVSLGTWLAFEKVAHPFVTGGDNVTTYDFAAALYILSTPSAEVFRAIRENDFEAAVLAIADETPIDQIEPAVAALQAHLERAFATAMPMRSGHEGGQKKTVASAGF